jgi:hypothetical protein
VFLEQEGDNRVFAHDTDSQVNVTQACTLAAGRYDVAAGALARARAALAHAHGASRRRLALLVTQRRASAARARRSASTACGQGIPL